MKEKIILFVKQYWREILIVIMFLSLRSGINEARENARYAYDYAADAASYARDASNYASEASDNASEASNYASEAADNASNCTY